MAIDKRIKKALAAGAGSEAFSLFANGGQSDSAAQLPPAFELLESMLAAARQQAGEIQQKDQEIARLNAAAQARPAPIPALDPTAGTAIPAIPSSQGRSPRFRLDVADRDFNGDMRTILAIADDGKSGYRLDVLSRDSNGNIQNVKASSVQEPGRVALQ